MCKERMDIAKLVSMIQMSVNDGTLKDDIKDILLFTDTSNMCDFVDELNKQFDALTEEADDYDDDYDDDWDDDEDLDP